VAKVCCTASLDCRRNSRHPGVRMFLALASCRRSTDAGTIFATVACPDDNPKASTVRPSRYFRTDFHCVGLGGALANLMLAAQANGIFSARHLIRASVHLNGGLLRSQRY